jgi:hypothetical protein
MLHAIHPAAAVGLIALHQNTSPLSAPAHRHWRRHEVEGVFGEKCRYLILHGFLVMCADSVVPNWIEPPCKEDMGVRKRLRFITMKDVGIRANKFC